MPHLSRRAKMDIPAQVLIEIASEPGKYKAMVNELTKRKSDAHDAEAKGKVETDKAAVAWKKAERAEKRANDAQEECNSGVAALAAHTLAKQQEFDQRQEKLDERSAVVLAAEQSVKNGKASLVEQAKGLAAQVEAANSALLRAEEIERGLAERAEAIRIREGKFANRLREFTANL